MLALRLLAAALVVLMYTGTAFAQTSAPVVFSERFVRPPGAPETSDRSFVVSPWIIGPFTLRVQNGDPGSPGPVAPAWVSINGTRVVAPPEGSVIRAITLQPRNTLQVRLAGDRGRYIEVSITGTSGDRTAPQLTLLEPTAPSVNTPTVRVRWRYSDSVGAGERGASGVVPSTFRLSVDGIDRTSSVVVNASEASAALDPGEGAHALQAWVSDLAGNVRTADASVYVDSVPPALSFTSPSPGTYLKGPMVNVTGVVSDASPVRVTLNGAAATIVGARFSGTVAAPDGPLTVHAVALDAAGNTAAADLSMTVDTVAPSIEIVEPVAGLITSQSSIRVAGIGSDSSPFSVRLNGADVPIANGRFAADVSVPLEGTNTVLVTAQDLAGNATVIGVSITADRTPPQLTIVSPGQAAIVANLPFTVQGSVVDLTSVSVAVDGAAADVVGSEWRASINALPDGDRTLTVVATDAAGNRTTLMQPFVLDTTPPVLRILQPAPGASTTATEVTVTGTVDDLTLQSVVVNGTVAVIQDAESGAGTGSPGLSGVEGSRIFVAAVPVAEGANTLSVTAQDRAGHETRVDVSVTADRTPPQLTIASPGEAAIIANLPFTVQGSVVDLTSVRVAVDGASADVVGSEWSARVDAAADGDHMVTVVATDAVGNQSTLTRQFILDTTPPVVTILEPMPETSTSSGEVTVSGTVDDLTLRSLVVNGIPATLAGSGFSRTFQATVAVAEGDNLIVATATDATGRGGEAQVHLTKVTVVPCSYDVSPSNATSPAGGGNATLTVSSAGGCQWTASTPTPWITITEIATGYRAQVVGDSAVGYWRLDDIDGATTARDSSGQGLDGTLFGGYTQGVPGALADGNDATRFEGGYVQSLNGPALLGGPFTVEAWLQDPWWGTVASGSGWWLTIESGRVRFRSERNEVERFNVLSERSLDDGYWHHLVATYDPGHQTARVFVDGVLEASGPAPEEPLHGSAFFMIGPLSATLDELAVYRSALTPEQVARHFDQQMSTGGGAGMVTYTVAPNPSFQPRAGIVNVAGFAIPIAQAGQNCFTVAPATLGPGTGGATGTIHITAIDSGCAWTASSSAAWISLDRSSGTGSVDVQYTVVANSTPLDRSAILTMAGRSVSVSQSGVPVQRPGSHYSVAAGVQHSLALKDDGSVWSWGTNTKGQLGDGTLLIRAVAVAVSSLANVVAIAAGDAHSLALKSDGTVWAWGTNAFGQIAGGGLVFRAVPGQVSGLSNVVAIAAGSEHGLALKADGTVWAWGRNNVGQLGDGTNTNRPVPTIVSGFTSRAIAVAASGSRTFVVDAAGQLWAFGFGTVTPTQVALTTPVVTPVASASGWFALAADGAVWGLGANDRGQLGDGTTTSPAAPVQLSATGDVLQLSAGQWHTLAWRTDGTVDAWGGNDASQLGDGTPPCPSGSDFLCPSRQYSAIPIRVAGPVNIAAVSANGNGSTSLAVSADGRVWAWGKNDGRQLGEGTIVPRSSPVQIADAGFVWHTGTPILTSGGTFNAEWVAIAASATPGAVIHYTLNGADPTESDPLMPSAPSGIAITQTTTLKARAWAAGKPPSGTAMETYTLKALSPGVSPAGGTYTAAQTVSLTTSTAGATIRYTVDGIDPTGASPAYSSPIPIGTGTVLKAAAFKSGWTPSAVASATYVFNFGTLTAPGISPLAGTYLYGQPVTLTAAAIATIRYTTDGSVPTVVSSVYSGPLTLSGALTLKVAAFHPDWTASPVVTTTYAAKVAAPTFSPGGGTYTADQQITVADATPGTTIHYTNNGVDPTAFDPVVANGGLLPVGNYTLKARAFRPGLVVSDVTSVEYARSGDPCRYTVTPPVINVGPGAGGGVLSLTATDSGCVWTSSTDVSWVIVSPATGTGATGQLVYHLSANPDASVRTGLLTIGGTDVLIVQGGTAPCTYSVTPGGVAAPAQATNGEVTVTASDGSCGWSVATEAPWLSVDATGNPSAYAEVVSADHPVGYWRLTDPVGAALASDVSGFGRTATVIGGVTFGSAGPLADRSTAASFDGRTGAIEIAHDAGLSLTALTWEAWVNVPTVSSEWRWILGEGASDEVFSVWIAPGSHRATLYYDLVGGGRQAVSLEPTVVGAGWVHLAFAFGATAWHAYVNGVEEQTGPSGGALAASAGPIVFGRDYVGDSWYDGQLAEAALYPYALSAEQIAYHAAQRGVMVRGGGHFTYVVAANLTATSRSATMTVGGTTVPVMQAAIGGIAIAGSPSSMTSSGWTNTDVTVSFVCAGVGAIACPSPVRLSRDGEHDVPGQAVNDLGGTASTTVHVRVDRTAPYLSVSFPSLGQLVSAGGLAVRGTTIDLLSGLTGVTCNDQPATLTDTAFLCNTTIPPGMSTVTLRAFDAASNMRVTTVSVTTEDTVSSSPPTRVRVTPQNVTMLAGETRRFSLLDNLDRIPSHAEWTIDNANVATLSTTPEVQLTAVSAGDVTLTASWRGLTATTRVTVLGTAAAAVGATIWSAPPVYGSVERIVQGAVTLDNERRLYALEHDDAIAQDLIRAFDADGRELWAASVPGRVMQLSGDPFGGVVALHDGTITGFTPGGSGFPIGVESGPGFAIDPDGATYYVRQGVLIAGSGSVPLPEPETPGGSIDAGIPTVLEDGRVAVPIHLTNTGLTPDKVQLVVNMPDGGTTVHTVWESPAAVLLQDGTWSRPPADAVTPYKAVPNGRGDILVAWSAIHTFLGSTNSNPASAYVGVMRGDGQPSAYVSEVGGVWGIPGRYPFGDLVVAEDRVIATAYRLFEEQNEAVASQLTLTGSIFSQNSWSVPEGQVPQFPTFLAAAGGGFIVSYPDGTMGADDPVFSQMHLAKAQYQGNGAWIGTAGRGPTAVIGPAVAEANSVWSGAQGGGQLANSATRPGVGLYVKGQPVFLGYFHASIIMVPRQIDLWIKRRPDVFGPLAKRFPDEGAPAPVDAYQNYFGTLGAESSLPGLQSCGGLLKSNLNRERDVAALTLDLERLSYSSLQENQLIKKLLNLDAHYSDDLRYECFPDAGTEEYNSNSYASGLLRAAKVPEPRFPAKESNRYPGWLKPVPEDAFK